MSVQLEAWTECIEVLPRGQGYRLNYHFRGAKVHLCICLAYVILSIIPFAKRKYTCVFVLRALSGPAGARLQPKLWIKPLLQRFRPVRWGASFDPSSNHQTEVELNIEVKTAQTENLLWVGVKNNHPCLLKGIYISQSKKKRNYYMLLYILDLFPVQVIHIHVLNRQKACG